MRIVPITSRDEANAFIALHHRHNGEVQGWKFACGLESDGILVGIAIAGRPTSRVWQRKHPLALEVTRVAVDGTKNANSKLYGAIARAAQALGWEKLYTYTRPSESGASLKAAGWVVDGVTDGGSWDRPSRRRTDKTDTERKIRWRKDLAVTA